MCPKTLLISPKLKSNKLRFGENGANHKMGGQQTAHSGRWHPQTTTLGCSALRKLLEVGMSQDFYFFFFSHGDQTHVAKCSITEVHP